MKFELFHHPLVSHWNHGNAYCLRGVVAALHRVGTRAAHARSVAVIA